MNERLITILKSPWTTHIAAGVAGIGGGVVVGYVLWGRNKKAELYVLQEEPQLEFDFDTEGLADERRMEAAKERQAARVIIDEEAYNSPVTVPETTAEVTDTEVIVRPDHVELVEVNVFEQEDSEWDWDLELLQRGGKEPHEPYILHREEFYKNEHNWTQSSLTYYAGDNIMADQDDKPVYDFPKIIGDLRFGHGSASPEVVFVRNEKLRGEYEIVLHPGRYEVEVQGLEYEEHEADQDLRHSKVSRFRPSD